MEVSQLCSTSVLRDELRGRVSRKALRILEVSSQNREYSQKHIAESVKCSVRYVRKVLSGHAKQAAQAAEKGAASNRKWYEIIANNHLASVSAAIFASEWTASSTDLLNPSNFRDLTKAEEKANTFPHSLYSDNPQDVHRSQAYVRLHLSGQKKSSLGFLLMDAHTEGGSSTSEPSDITRLLELVDTNKNYARQLRPIFQTLQSKGIVKMHGDLKRRQAKLSDLAAVAELRLHEAEAPVKRLERSAAKAQSQGAALALLQMGKKRQGGEALSSPTRKKSKKTSEKASTEMKEAQQILDEVKAEYETVCNVLDYMCKGFERIRKVRPF